MKKMEASPFSISLSITENVKIMRKELRAKIINVCNKKIESKEFRGRNT